MTTTLEKPTSRLAPGQRAWLKNLGILAGNGAAEDGMGIGAASAGAVAPGIAANGPAAPVRAFASGNGFGGNVFASPTPPNKTGNQSAPLKQNVQPPKQPIVYTKTTQVDATQQKRRNDKLPNTRADTEAKVTQVVEAPEPRGHNGVKASTLDSFSRIVQQANANGAQGLPVIPTAAETKTIREQWASVNDALLKGDMEKAARISRSLGLPISDDDVVNNFSKLTDDQRKTLIALGGVRVDVKQTVKSGQTTYSSLDGIVQTPSKALNALNGNAGYAQLVDDMAALGVTPLDAPPSQDQLKMYMDNLQAQAQRQAEIDFPNKPDDQQKAVSKKLADASQMLMDGMQVHYRGAGGNDPNYGHTATFSTFLLRNNKLVTDANGDPVKLEVASNLNGRARQQLIAPWVRTNGGGTPFTCATDTPEGFGDNTSRGVYGNRHESDCEGMASFRLRTLPTGFTPVGVVSGRLRAGGIGHVVAVYKSSDGRVFLSSNGKKPIEVTAGGSAVSSNDIHPAVVQEFQAIYHGHAEADFFFGIAKPGTFTGTPVQAANSTADQLMKDAGNDDILQSNAATRNKVPPVDWNKLQP